MALVIPKLLAKWTLGLAPIGGWLACPGAALAQGCAMCYSDAAAQNQAGIRALQHGILVLLIPSVLMFLAIFAVAYRRRDQFNDPEVAAEYEGKAPGASH